MGVCSPKLTRYLLSPAKIAELIAGKGGSITLSTTPHAMELAEMEPQYWRFHSPWGNPGDLVWALENYRIDRVCQNAEGYTVTVKFEDQSELSSPSLSPMAVTAKGTFISGSGGVPDLAIRVKLVIQDVQIVGDDWVFTVAMV